ncbi:hypothetical protein FHS15_005645 [Paenibacillus castaneae]|uniref:HEAT repeat domain-containing protein n=1 Tax=Paenibacillus castaneae TaxID=474957 RepID=UPI000C9BA291|nr:HEAT repeat domain-containing protein [Paenibacillus castaneae]NIK80455.1 hypothetical protein [Paenibacillus castaneae]
MIKKTGNVTWDMLEEELNQAGVPISTAIDNTLLNPTDVLVMHRISAKPYIDILLKYAPKLELSNKTWIARIVSEKGLKQAVPFLISIFEDYKGENIDLWAVGNALYVIDDRASYSAILELCKNPRYGIARQMLMGTLAKMKTKEAYEVLIDCFNDETVRGHAIEAIGKFGDIRAIPLLEKLEVKKGLYEYKARETAIKRLSRKIPKQ